MKVGPYEAKIIFSLMIGPLIFLLPHNVLAWGGEEGGVDYGPSGYGYGYGGCGGYCAGQQDAQYDLSNNYQYQPYGSCLPCHSPDYWANFKLGYDHYWNENSGQQQQSTQGASIVINGNNNYASIGQTSGQTNQNPLQQLAHTVCGWINCNNNGPQPYQQQQQQQQGYQDQNQNVPYNPY